MGLLFLIAAIYCANRWLHTHDGGLYSEEEFAQLERECAGREARQHDQAGREEATRTAEGESEPLGNDFSRLAARIDALSRTSGNKASS